MRKIEFQNNYYYHVYNRGVDKRNIFLSKYDFTRFIWSLRLMNNNTTKGERDLYFRDHTNEKELSSVYTELSSSFDETVLEFLSWIDKQNKLSEIIAYSLMSNHYHFLLKQIDDNGISKFLHKINTAYTNYFNKKNKRSGSLFQGKFKAVKIKTDEKLLYLSAYINANSKIHNICPADNWSWSSYLDYLDLRNGKLPNKNIIISQFNNIEEYRKYVNMVVSDTRLKRDKNSRYTLE